MSLDRKLISSCFRPYTTSLDITLERITTMCNFLKKLKKVLDPNDIMNRGKFL